MVWKNDQVSEIETEKVLKLAQACIMREGDYVELGCYRGDTSLLLADLLDESGKRLYIYDSFEGLPEKSAEDSSALGTAFRGGELYVTKREVKERFLRANLPVPVIKKAWFSDLGSEDLPEKIAFAFLDGDFYESIKDSLRLVGSKMASSGIIVVHDYNNLALPGVKKATDEWMMGRDGLKTEIFQSMLIIYFNA